MQNLPHYYIGVAMGATDGVVTVGAPGLPDLATAPPAEFGGPGDLWSPETLLVGAVADCFILTFRAVARAAHLDWHGIRCEAEGVLDRVERVTRFTKIHLSVILDLPPGSDRSIAQQAIEKAEKGCLITNSLNAEVHFATEIRTSVAA
jgi:organic hydroperoxide reductase OsmC/OhrA